MMTIAELIEAIEEITSAKVIKLSESDGKLTIELEYTEIDVNEEMDISISGDYFFSVDDDGIPDHVYIGLVKDDGSLPSDAINLR